MSLKSINQSIKVTKHRSIHRAQSVCLSVSLSNYRSQFLLIYLSIYLSQFIQINQSIDQSFYLFLPVASHNNITAGFFNLKIMFIRFSLYLQTCTQSSWICLMLSITSVQRLSFSLNLMDDSMYIYINLFPFSPPSLKIDLINGKKIHLFISCCEPSWYHHAAECWKYIFWLVPGFI